MNLIGRFIKNEPEVIPKLLQLGYVCLSKSTHRFGYLMINAKKQIIGKYTYPSEQEKKRLGIGEELKSYELLALEVPNDVKD